MTEIAEASPAAEIAPLVRALQDAWNRADGDGFAAQFAEDADFVNVYGMHARGRQQIAHGHRFIFTTVYRGSQVAYELEGARLLGDGVALAHVHARLRVPAGPAAGEMEARWSAVLTREAGEWRIASFHNTFIREPPTPPASR